MAYIIYNSTNLWLPMPEDKFDSEELEGKPVYRLFPEAFDALKRGICPTCGKKVTGFRDSLSLKDYKISGVCQNCQDGISRLPQT